MKKSFEVDVSSEQECLKLIGVLKSHLGQIRLTNGGDTRAERIKREFDACVEILNTPIDCVYADQELDTTLRYYVYAHLDSTRRIAIGKDGKTTFAATLGMEFFPF